MTIKAQCEKHGCSELLCGCPVSCLESSSDFHEILRAKDKWINSLLDINHASIKYLSEALKLVDNEQWKNEVMGFIQKGEVWI